MQGLGSLFGLSLLRTSSWSSFLKPCVLICSTNDNLYTERMLGGVRLRHSKRVNQKVQKLVDGGIKYPGFTYFPRFPDQQDPPYEPSKLFMVKRIRGLRGMPWWEKDMIKKLKIEDRRAVAIVKNTPMNNAKLYMVKHLVQITAISTPFGMPDNANYGFLKENGEFISYNCLEGHQLQLEDAKLQGEELKKKSVDGETLKRRLKLQWYSRY